MLMVAFALLATASAASNSDQERVGPPEHPVETASPLANAPARIPPAVGFRDMPPPEGLRGQELAAYREAQAEADELVRELTKLNQQGWSLALAGDGTINVSSGNAAIAAKARELAPGLAAKVNVDEAVPMRLLTVNDGP